MSLSWSDRNNNDGYHLCSRGSSQIYSLWVPRDDFSFKKPTSVRQPLVNDGLKAAR